MSHRVEWMDATMVGIQVLPQGEEVGENQVTAPYGLAINADTIVIIEGNREQLTALLSRALYEVTTAPQPRVRKRR